MPHIVYLLFIGSPSRNASRGGGTGKQSTILAALLAKKPKGRPSTPDFTLDRLIVPPKLVTPEEGEEGSVGETGNGTTGEEASVSNSTDGVPLATVVDNTNYELKNNLEFQAAVVLLQRLIRGRAVQNIMFEGDIKK